jgi:hypothetical protein
VIDVYRVSHPDECVFRNVLFVLRECVSCASKYFDDIYLVENLVDGVNNYLFFWISQTTAFYSCHNILLSVWCSL